MPGVGFGGTLEFGSGLSGRERRRTWIPNAGVLLALQDRVSFSLHHYSGLRDDNTSGGFARGKVRLLNPFGLGTALGLHLSHAWSSIREEPFQ